MAQLEVDSTFQAETRSLLGLVAVVLIGAVATAAGVGGGAIYIPLFNVLVGFALKPSTALSQACITASSLAAVLSNLPRNHPSVPEVPLIDFPLILLLTPVLLVGVGIGVLLNVALPSWLLNILLLALLLLLLVQAVAKGRALWVQETKRAQAAGLAVATARVAGEKSSDGGAGPAAASSGGESREALLPADHQGSSHSPAAAAAAVAGPAGLRLRRGQSYTIPRGPLGLEPDQDTSLGCSEGLGESSEATTAASYGGPLGQATAAAAGRRRAADVSWDCMEGVVATFDGAAVSCETPSSDAQRPSSAFLNFAAFPTAGRALSSTGADDVAAVGIGRYGTGPGPSTGPGGTSASPGTLSPASSLAYAPSWRAFNELGALDWETDLEEAACGEGGEGSAAAAGGGAAGGGDRQQHTRRSTRPSGFGSFGSPSSSPMLMPPTARLLVTQLMRWPSRSPGSGAAAARQWPPLTRRSSFDPVTGHDIGFAGADEETGPSGDSWLQRRSKWRSRFPLGALPHRGGSRAPLLPVGGALQPPSSSAAVPFPSSMQSLPSIAASSSSSVGAVSGRISGSGMARLRNRPLRHVDVDGGGDDVDGGGDVVNGGDAGLDQPLMPDPRSEYGSVAAGAIAVDGVGGGGGGGGFTAVDAYRPTLRLATLHEEVDDRAESRPSAAGAAFGDATGGVRAGSRWKPPAAAAAAHSPYVPSAATTGTPQSPALPLSSHPTTERDPSLAPPTGPAASAVLYDRHDGPETPPASSMGQFGYLRIECGPAVSTEADRRQRLGVNWRSRWSEHACGGAAAAAVRKWAEDWALALRRIPPRFAGGLVFTWAIYLALQGARAFRQQCSPAWWGLFVAQVVAMLGISVAALVMAAAALARHAEAAEAAGGAAGLESMEGGTEGATAAAAIAQTAQQREGEVAQVAAAAAEPALGGTAALLVLQAPLQTLCATFGAGLTGGLLGLGGGMVMGPLLLQIGVQPQVTAASSGAMVLFSSSAALIQFVLLHRLNTDYALVFGAASLVAGLAGTNAVSRAIRRSGRPSVVVLALAGVMAIGTVCVAVFGLRNAAVQLRSGQLGFAGICSVRGGK